MPNGDGFQRTRTSSTMGFVSLSLVPTTAVRPLEADDESDVLQALTLREKTRAPPSVWLLQASPIRFANSNVARATLRQTRMNGSDPSEVKYTFEQSDVRDLSHLIVHPQLPHLLATLCEDLTQLQHCRRKPRQKRFGSSLGYWMLDHNNHLPT